MDFAVLCVTLRNALVAFLGSPFMSWPDYSKVVTAWFSFLPTMKRSFIVCGNPSEALDSDCGLPEGDSLSCLGMVLLNFSYHYYLRLFNLGSPCFGSA